MSNIQITSLNNRRSSNRNTHLGEHICKCPNSKLHKIHDEFGGSFFDVVKNPLKHIRALTRGIRQDYTPKVYEFILRNYSEELVSFEVCRRPLSGAVNKMLNIGSFGRWDKEKHKYGYDTFFHLFIVAKTKAGKQFVIEKNAVINVSEYRFFRQKGDVCIKIPPPSSPIKLGIFMKKAETHMKSRGYFEYDPFKNNCQVFVFNVLRANGLMDDKLKAFIMQDVEGIVSGQRSYFPRLARKITDLGGLADKFLEGETDREEIKEKLKPDLTEEAVEGGTLEGGKFNPASLLGVLPFIL